jgi:hypothetical protein
MTPASLPGGERSLFYVRLHGAPRKYFFIYTDRSCVLFPCNCAAGRQRALPAGPGFQRLENIRFTAATTPFAARDSRLARR